MLYFLAGKINVSVVSKVVDLDEVQRATRSAEPDAEPLSYYCASAHSGVFQG